LIIKLNYSIFKLFTGLATAALIAWKHLFGALLSHITELAKVTSEEERGEAAPTKLSKPKETQAGDEYGQSGKQTR
jgi:hypothetical protein